MSRNTRSQSRGDGIRVSFRVYPRTHGELHLELRDLPPGERGPRLLFLAQLGRLARASITSRTALSAPDSGVRGVGAGLPQLQDDFRKAIAELDLSSFNLT